MTQTQTGILVVDDEVVQGGIITETINQQPGYQTFSPQSQQEIFGSILFGTYEGVFIDIRWKEWKPPVRLNRKKIEDGIDFARFLFDINPKLTEAIALYSSQGTLRDPRREQRIKNLPFRPMLIASRFTRHLEENEKKLSPLLVEATKVHRANPLIQSPKFISQSPNTRLHVYKSVLAEYSKWINFQFKVTGDYSWTIICGSNIQKDYYGAPLNGGHTGFGITSHDQYPSAAALSKLSKQKQFFPFIVWNLRKVEFLASQFELAGPGLKKIPQKWRSFFGIAVSKPCADAYLNGQGRQVLRWCQELDHDGRIEVLKQIYKLLRKEDAAHLEKFARRCEALELPVIADILTGKVDKVHRDAAKPKNAFAKVVLRTHGGDAFIETFTLQRLEASGIRFVDTWFEYTVYQHPRSEVAALIEPYNPDEEQL